MIVKTKILHMGNMYSLLTVVHTTKYIINKVKELKKEKELIYTHKHKLC